ncbi:hypothetical protein D3C81_1674560 [compost metagenome]
MDVYVIFDQSHLFGNFFGSREVNRYVFFAQDQNQHHLDQVLAEFQVGFLLGVIFFERFIQIEKNALVRIPEANVRHCVFVGDKGNAV